MARYWSDGYGETEQVGDAASYSVTVIDRVRWDNKQDKLYFDNAPTLGSSSPVTSDGIARALNEVREYVRQKDNELFYIDVVTQDGIEALRDKTYIDIHEAYKSGDTLILRFADSADKCAYFYDFQGNVFRFVLFEATDVLSMYTYWISPDDLLHVETYSAPYKRPNPETFAITYGEDSVVYDGSKHASVNIPKVPAWALNDTKPKYTASEVGAEEKGIAASRVSAHDSNANAHADIRNIINNVVNMFNSYVTQEQFQQLYNRTQTNASNINQLHNDAVLDSDIVDDLYTNNAMRPLSARQGMLLRSAVDKITPKDAGLLLWDGYSLHAQDYYVAVPSAHGLPIADEGGRLSTNAPASALHCANKQYVDDAILSPAVIKQKVSGKTILTTDSVNASIKGLQAQGDSSQKRYEGNQLFDLANATIDNPNELSSIVVDGNKLILTAGRSTTTGYARVFVDLKAGITYKLSCVSDKTAWVLLFNNGGSYIKDITTATFTPTYDGTHHVYFYTKGCTATGETQTYYNIMLNEGTEALPYEPYVGNVPSPNTEYPQEVEHLENVEVKVLRINLFDVEKALETGTTVELGGKTYFKFENGQTYTMSFEAKKISDNIWFCATSDSWERGRLSESIMRFSSIARLTKTFTIPNDGLEYYLCTCVGGTPTRQQFENMFNGTTSENLQIQLGTVATEYEPYTEQTITINTPVPFTKWDKLVNRDGVWGVSVYHLKIVPATAVNDWGYSKNEPWFSHNALPYVFTRRDGYCNQLRAITKVSQRTESNIIEIGAGNKYIYVWNTDFYDSTLADKGQSKFLAHLKENPLEIWTYADEEQDFIPLAEEEQEKIKYVMMHYPTTTILSNATLEVEYVVDPALFIKNNYVDKEQHQALADRVLVLEQLALNL